MTTDQNKATARRFVEEGLNKNNWTVLNETQDTNFVEHQANPAGFATGREGFKQYFTAFHTAFPDLRYSIDDEFGEGEKVVQRVTGNGTMKGEFAGMPATGKHAVWSEIHITHFANGKVMEHWGTIDQAGMMAQLGVSPEPMRKPM